MYQRKYTPEAIMELQENEVFVFGSNEGGLHMGGAANVAGQEYLVKREARNKFRGYKKLGLLIDVTVLEFVKVERNDTEGA